MNRKKYFILFSLILIIIFFLFSSCSYIIENGKYVIKKFLFFIRYNIKSIYFNIDNLFTKIWKKINRFSVFSKNFSISNNIFFQKPIFSSKSKINEFLNHLVNFGKKYDDLVLNTMLLYSSNGIPLDKNIIINIYTSSNNKKPDITRLHKYHFKIIEVSKEEYDKLNNLNMNKIENTIINSKNSGLNKKAVLSYLYVKEYKLILKNSKPAILCHLKSNNENNFLAILENLPSEFYSIPDEYSFYIKNSFPKIKYHTFYYYPLSSSLLDVVIGFYYPINPLRFFAFFAIIFIIIIILLVIGFILLKQYLFTNLEYKNKKIKKLENIKNMDNNIDEKDIVNNNKNEEKSIYKNEENIKTNLKDETIAQNLERKEKKEQVMGEEINISEIPDFNDF